MDFWTLSIIRHSNKFEKSRNPVILSVIHHRQNPLESTIFTSSGEGRLERDLKHVRTHLIVFRITAFLDFDHRRVF
jgi:hypothetical protein